MISLPRHDNHEHPKPGTWRKPTEGGQTVWQAIISCTKCGDDCTVRLDRAVSADGVVGGGPVICRCGWREHVQLVEWD